jgi:hypothetical protein
MLVVTVNDRPLEVAAIVQRGRVLVPMRAVFAALGADVRYDARNRVVVARTRAHDVVVQLGDRTPIVDGRTYVPLRFVAQALGASVAYDGKAQIVSVRTPNLAATPEPVAPAQAPLPEMPPEPAYDYQFYVSGARAFYPGDWMHFTLVAPPGGTAESRAVWVLASGVCGHRTLHDVDGQANCRASAGDRRSVYDRTAARPASSNALAFTRGNARAPRRSAGAAPSRTYTRSHGRPDARSDACASSRAHRASDRSAAAAANTQRLTYGGDRFGEIQRAFVKRASDDTRVDAGRQLRAQRA